MESEKKIHEKIASKGAIFFGSNVVTKAFGFLFMVISGRFLGPSNFGLLSLGMAVLSLVQKIGAFGLPNTIQRFLSGRTSLEKKSKYGTILALGGGLALTGGLVMFITAPYIANNVFRKTALVSPLKVLAVAAAAGVLYTVGRAVLQAREEALKLFVVSSANSIGRVILAVSILPIVATATMGAWTIVGAFLISGGVLLFCLSRLELKPKLGRRPRHLKTVASYSAPLVIVGLGYFIGQRADRLMLGWLGKASEVGLYTAASTLALGMTLVLQSLGQIFMPIASDAYDRGDNQELEEAYRLVGRWSALAGGIAFLIFLAFGKELLTLFGASYSGVESYWALITISMMYLVGCGVGPTGVFLQMTDAHRVEAINTILFVVANITLNYISIPIWGVWGAAAATALSGVFRNGLQVAQIVRLYQIRLVRWPTIAILGIAAMCATLVFTVGPSSKWTSIFSVLCMGVIIIVAVVTASKKEVRLFYHYTTGPTGEVNN